VIAVPDKALSSNPSTAKTKRRRFKEITMEWIGLPKEE
jgi:hypothetical protein